MGKENVDSLIYSLLALGLLLIGQLEEKQNEDDQ